MIRYLFIITKGRYLKMSKLCIFHPCYPCVNIFKLAAQPEQAEVTARILRPCYSSIWIYISAIVNSLSVRYSHVERQSCLIGCYLWNPERTGF